MIGLITTDDSRAPWVRVWIDGKDVTARCFAADDRHGWAACYLHREGKPYLTTSDQIACEVLTGKVEVLITGRER